MRPTLPDVLRSMSTNTPMTTHSESCWQWHRSCAGLVAADMIEDLVDENQHLTEQRNRQQRKIGGQVEAIQKQERALVERNAEITRHHTDFAQWEDMADKGAAQIESNRVMRAALVNIIPFLDQVVANRSDLNPYCERAWGHLNAAKDAIA